MFIERKMVMAAYQAMQNPQLFKWSTQGFGFLRCYLDNEGEYRLHIWRKELRDPAMDETHSDIHTHPWNFRSRVLHGTMFNTRYFWEPQASTWSPGWTKYYRQLMKPGAEAHMLDSPEKGTLIQSALESWGPGDEYEQRFDEIHRPRFEQGTVTLIRRERGDRADEAYAFYLADREWASAAPVDVSPYVAARWITSTMKMGAP